MSGGTGNIEELKGVVAKALEAKGVLSRLRAELRKCVFEVMEEQEKGGAGAGSASSSRVVEILSTDEGRKAASLVADFLSVCQLDHSLSVFRSEASLQGVEIPKSDLADALGVIAEPDEPLIYSCLDGKGSSASPKTGPGGGFAGTATFRRGKLAQALAVGRSSEDDVAASPTQQPPAQATKPAGDKQSGVVKKSHLLGPLPSLGGTSRKLPSLKPVSSPASAPAAAESGSAEAKAKTTAADDNYDDEYDDEIAEDDDLDMDYNDADDFDDGKQHRDPCAPSPFPTPALLFLSGTRPRPGARGDALAAPPGIDEFYMDDEEVGDSAEREFDHVEDVEQ